MPAPGDVDIVIAAELMEAGRAIMRGLVTPNRTTLIASSHRAYAVSEKMAPGDGIADASKVLDIATQASHRLIAFDMESIAARNGSVISASLFGALAGSGALPFTRATASKRRSRPAAKAWRQASRLFPLPAMRLSNPPAAEAEPQMPPAPVMTGRKVCSPSMRRSHRGSAPICRWARAPWRKPGLPRSSISRISITAATMPIACARCWRSMRIQAAPHHDYALTRETAKYLANAMCYDDIIRVADAKTRGSRFARVHDEVKASDAQVLTITEFMHPRLREVLGTLPTGLARWIESKPALCRMLNPLFDRGRHVRTDGFAWFSLLYGLAGLRGMRRKLLRHEVESAHTRAMACRGRAPGAAQLRFRRRSHSLPPPDQGL